MHFALSGSGKKPDWRFSQIIGCVGAELEE